MKRFVFDGGGRASIAAAVHAQGTAAPARRGGRLAARSA